MAKKDKPKSPNPDEEAVIEKRVKQMMDPNEPDPDPAPELPGADDVQDIVPELGKDATDASSPPPLDIFGGKDMPGTAPEQDEKPTENAMPTEALEPAGEQPEAPVVGAKQDDPLPALADPATDKAVDEITKAEGDEVLKAEDRLVDQAFLAKPGIWERWKDATANRWGDPKKRFWTLCLLLAILVAAMAVPVSRYFVLNTLGVRSHLSVKVLDNTNDLPLKNVQVTLAGQTGKTDSNGQVTLGHVKLGVQTVTIDKAAFAPYQKKITIGLTGASLSNVGLKAVGTQFTFNVTDYLSGKGISGAEVSSGDAYAQSGKNGEAILTVQPPGDQKLPIQVTGKGYRTAELSIVTTAKKPISVSLVNATKEVYVSKQSGHYNLYSIDIDGKHKQLLLAGTGLEGPNISLSVSPDNSEAALVSTRDNVRDADGYLLNAVTLINLTDGSSVTIDHAEQVKLLGWANGYLVYESTSAGSSASNHNRQKLISYQYGSRKRLQLAASNYFTAADLVGSTVYYATSSTDTSTAPAFREISVDGTGNQVILNGDVWSVFRTAYDTFALQTPHAWAAYKTGSSGTQTISAPQSYVSRKYLDDASHDHSLWVDTRDGQGVLLDYDVSTRKDKVVVRQGGLSDALRWLGNGAVVYRVTDSQETADYAVSLDGGKPHKIVNVTATYSTS